MLSERMLSKVVEACTANYLQLKPCDEAFMPSPNPGPVSYTHLDVYKRQRYWKPAPRAAASCMA